MDVAQFVFEGNQFNGDVAPALAQLHDSGTVRIIDLAFVIKDADGKTASIEVEDADVADSFAAVTGNQLDLLSDSDLEFMAETLEPNTSALVVVWENAWATRFLAAVRGSGGRLSAMERIPRDAVLNAIAALAADEEE
ncbi:MAG: DUF6325 family protein [Propionicimonas sp.]